jgi:TatD DNase family protein
MKFLDIHTHSPYEDESSIQNIYAQNLDFIDTKGLISSGIHPWHINQVNIERCMNWLELALINSRLTAIGECGLDRLTEAPFTDQLQVFKRQISLANKYNKPLIIHCVKAYSDLIKLKKEIKTDIPWIIHGYHANFEITKSLIRQGFYFSIGERLLNDKKKHQLFQLIPHDRLFFETDESQLSIEKIYLLAAEILHIELGKLADLAENNFKSIFKNDKLVAQN